MKEKDTSQNWALHLLVNTYDKTFTLTEDDVADNSFKLARRSTDSDSLSIGSAVPADLSVTILNRDGELNDVLFAGATLTPQVGLEVSAGNFEWVPLGVFTVDTLERRMTSPTAPVTEIELKARDNLMLFDKPFSDVKVSFPCSALTLLQAVCSHCRVSLATTDFTNKDYIIKTRPEGDISCRNIVQYIAQISGCYATCNRFGQVVLKWYKNPAPVFGEASFDGNVDDIDGGNFHRWITKPYDGGVFKQANPDATIDLSDPFEVLLDDSPIEITGVIGGKDDERYIYGTSRYCADMSDNPLIQSGVENVLRSVGSKIIGTTCLPFSATAWGDPALDAGDMVELVDIVGSKYRTIVTDIEYSFASTHTIQCSVASEIESGYIGRNAATVKAQIAEKKQEINHLDDAIKQATNLIVNAFGGYAFQDEANFYIADNPDLNQAQKVWRWNIGGFGFSSTGVNGPYTVAMTQDSNFLANIITASWIRTGLLSSLNNKSWIDLDNGSFSLGDGALKWSAAEGFEAVSAKQIRNSPDDIFFAEMGSITNEGDEYQGVQIVTKVEDEEIPILTMATASGIAARFSLAGNVPFIISSPLGTSIRQPGGDKTSLLLSDSGVSFSDKNGAIGISRSLQINTPDGVKTLTIKNGLITNIS
ncbi:MAG: hypothetical protein ACOYH4_06645 [Saccharofermentanales bacterium]